MSGKFTEIYQQLETWFRGTAGQYLLEQERTLVDALLAERVFGLQQLQLGVTREHPLGLDSCLQHRVYAGATPGGALGLVTEFDSLPFDSDSIDLVLLHHAMEFAANPHALLREVHRVLAPHGHIVIIGFNPASLFGLNIRVRGCLPSNFWGSARCMSSGRLRDWLHLLGAEVNAVRHCFAIPPVGGERIQRYLSRADALLTRANLPAGGVYAMHAQKQVGGMTPLRKPWQRTVSDKLIDLTVPRPVPSPREGDVAA